MQPEDDFTLEYKFHGKVWKYQGPNGWYFVSIPHDLSKKIRQIHSESEEGWGRLKSEVSIHELTWMTSIWFDTKLDCYLLPLKASIRKKGAIAEGSAISIMLKLKI